MYHYTECGLNNIWLTNGYKEVKTPYGKAVSITHADELHQSIAMALVTEKPQLSGGEFRFIRKELDMSQKMLAEVLGNDAQSVARWEKQGRVPKMADRFLRILYIEHATGNTAIRELVEKINMLDRKLTERKILFESKGSNWKTKAA